MIDHNTTATGTAVAVALDLPLEYYYSVCTKPAHDDHDRIIELLRSVDEQPDQRLVKRNQVVRKHLGREVASRQDKQGDFAIRDGDLECAQHCIAHATIKFTRTDTA